MDNGQMARWVARVEHTERMQAQKQNEQFWRDIHPDDLEPAVASPIQPAGIVLFLKKSLASLRARMGTNRKSELAHTKTGYKQNSMQS